ncbi:MAG TPA: M56/M15 family metallopeptidase [Ohtaekwangia sp.]|nr:M56/M15 family metallopeptidase [Ohtaekwangia sp.]
MEGTLYLLQVSICLVAFYIMYWALFRTTTFFTVNRFYLLAAILFSFLLPILHVETVPIDYDGWTEEFISATPNGNDLTNFKPIVVNQDTTFDVFMLLMSLYCAGVAFMSFRFFSSVNRILKIKKRSTTQIMDQFTMVRGDIAEPFSFFNFIFLPSHDINPMIVAHEMAHIRQRHWIDLFIVETAHVLLWFNPVMLCYKRSLQVQHEYKADASTLAEGAPLEAYLNCLMRQIQNKPFSSTSNFYSTTIKNRIIMMTKNKTSRKYAWFYLALIPVVSTLFFAFSIHMEPIQPHLNPANDDQIMIVVDAAHGGHDTGAETTAGTSEKELALSIAKHLQKAAEEKGIKVIMTRNTDKALTLEERAKFSTRYEADLFISIHANYNAQDVTARGIECTISENNNKFRESKRFAEGLVNELSTVAGINVNGIKKSNAYILRNNKIPAVILELGYLSNPADYAYIQNDENQKMLSGKVITSVLRYAK